MKYAWMAKHAGLWPVAKLCRALEVSPSGFKAWRGGGKRSTQRLSDAQWRDAFRAGGYTPEDTARFIRRLKQKIAEGLALKG